MLPFIELPIVLYLFDILPWYVAFIVSTIFVYAVSILLVMRFLLVKSGLHLVLDMGKWWKKKYNLPLPLGANALLRRLSPEIRTEACRVMKESIQYAIDNREEALNYAMQFARDLEVPMAEKFVGMYVNHHTVDCGDDVPKAAQLLLNMGFEAGIIPNKVEIEFAR